MFRFYSHCSLMVLCTSLMLGRVMAVEVDGVAISFTNDSSRATVAAETIDKFILRIDVKPQTETEPLTLQVVLPETGRGVWPFMDVQVRDAKGQAVAVRRGGIEWHKLLITVPAERSSLIVQAVNPADEPPLIRSESERHATGPQTGLSATICRWYDGRSAALSLRFDDSHPTHLNTAIPILNDYGFRGTFMVNPGGHPPNSRRRSAFEEHRAEWEAVAKRGNHEFANHTLQHQGAQNDDEMDYQIGEASKALWKLFPDKCRLTALNLGGGTSWTTTKTLRHYLDKYHLFVVSGSTGMDDVYGNRVATFRRLLENHIERGLWYRVHFHYIGSGLSSSEENFRAALDIAKQHKSDLWIAGMADIYKYQTERQGAKLEMENKDDHQTILRVSCSTVLELYDQSLTIDLSLPESWAAERVVVRGKQGQEVETRQVNTPEGARLRFDVQPIVAQYTITKTPD